LGAILHFIRGLDVSIYYFLSRFASNGILCRMARLEEENDLLKGAVFFAILWHLWFREDGDQEKRRCGVIAVSFGSILAIFAARTIAFIAPFRLRPMSDPAILHPAYALSFPYNLEHWSGFPSDTAAYFFALAIGIAFLSRPSRIPILLYTCGWICLPRMFLGIHYASDIVVGIGIGAAVMWVAIKSKFVHSLVTQPLVEAANRSPQWFYPAAFLISFEMASLFAASRAIGSGAFHLAAAGLHFRHLGAASENRPIDVWGGLLGTAACMAILTYVLRTSFRKIQAYQRHHSEPAPKLRSRRHSHGIGRI
jgi:undecaprenyl-diphosphatase